MKLKTKLKVEENFLLLTIKDSLLNCWNICQTLHFAWNGIQTFIADVSVKQPFSRQFAITMRQIKINLQRKFGDSSGSHFIPETN